MQTWLIGSTFWRAGVKALQEVLGGGGGGKGEVQEKSRSAAPDQTPAGPSGEGLCTKNLFKI